MNQETPIFPLVTTYLPGDKVQLHIFEDRYVHMCSDIEKSNGQFVSVLIERGHEVGGSDTRSSYGVSITTDDMFRADGRILLSGHATHVEEISQWLPDDPYPRAICRSLLFQIPAEVSPESVAGELTALLWRLDTPEAIALRDAITHVQVDRAGSDEALGSFFWTVAGLIPSGPQDRYRLLEIQDVNSRLSLLSEMITHFTEISEFQGR